MKVYSVTPLADITQFRFRLNSVDANFNCYLRSGYDPENDSIGLPRTDRWASIEFKDSQEVDELIRILQRFRDEGSEYIGRWR